LLAVSGAVTYGQITEIVEALVCIKGRSVHIPGFGPEDIAQEIRTECFKAISKYDDTRIGPNPYTFLDRCVHNHLYNMRRGIYVPNNPPCIRCPFWDKANKTCTIDEMDPDDRTIPCRKITQYRQNMLTKASLKGPSTLENDPYDNNVSVDSDYIDLHESIREYLPNHLKDSYELMAVGRSDLVTHNHKKQIRELVRIMLDNAES
jgi:hypothetical protein